MADEQQLAILRQGVDAWNAWREQNPPILVSVDLVGADLSEANLSGADLSGANLYEAQLVGSNLSKAHLAKATLTVAHLSEADLSEADLSETHLVGANLSWTNLSCARLIDANLLSADLSGADLSSAKLIGANLSWANISRAQVIDADLSHSKLVETNFAGAALTGCRVYGISAWGLKLERAEQKNLIITPHRQPEITVDNLEVAQFIYLLLNNERVRHVIDTITSKVVLILGRFTKERKAVLDALREELRQRDYLPVLFDFEKPRSKSTLEAISTLAHMARFVIADLTDAKSVLQELQAVVPSNPSVPVQPLILATQEEPGMFDFFRLYPWMPEPYRYPDSMGLLGALRDSVIAPAELVLSKG